MSGLVIALVGHGDGLENHLAVGLQQIAAGRKIAAVELVANGLDHLDGHQLVVFPGQVAIVLAQHGDAILQAQLANLLLRILVLLPGDGCGGDPAAVVAGRVNGHAAPAGAYFHQVIVSAELQLAAYLVQLGHRGALERCRRFVEQGGGVHHGGVQEQAEKVVAQVVMR